DGQVRMGILPDQLGLQGRSVAQGELVGFDGAHDVAVGEGVAVGGDQHPGSNAADADHGGADRVDYRDHGLGEAIEEIDIGDHFVGPTQRGAAYTTPYDGRQWSRSISPGGSSTSTG